ncbi:MAG: hypothetical protein ACK2UY_12700 [Anaerolineae bacterium]
MSDIPVALEPEEILAMRGGRRVQPGLLRDAEAAIALGQSLWQPAAVYGWFDVLEVAGEEVRLAPTGSDEEVEEDRPETVLHIGPKADLLAGARRALVGVGTIGPALEARAQELQAAREVLNSYLLDSAGVVALGAVGEALRCLAEEAAAAEGWGVSPALSPGSLVGWPLTGQRALCGLLPLADVGVRLNGYCVLEPHKSFSSLIGLGPGFHSGKVGSVCKFCALQDTCWRRREDPS